MGSSLFVPLNVEYDSDDKVIEAGPLAELLYIRSLAFCKRTMSDGVVRRSQMVIVGRSIPDATEHAATLVAVGLWEPCSDGWRVASWLKHNKSTEQLAAKKAAALLRSQKGVHTQFHKPEDPPRDGCPFCPGGDHYEDDKETNGSTSGSTSGSTLGLTKEKEEEEAQEKEEEESSRHGPGGRPKSDAPGTADDDRKVETIIDHIIAKRTEGRRIQDPIAHLRTSRANFARQERLGLDMMLAKRPHMLDSPELAAEFYLAQMARGGAA